MSKKSRDRKRGALDIDGNAMGIGVSPKRKLTWIVFAVGVLAYIQTIAYDFTYDDVPIIRDDQTIRSVGNIPSLFAMNYWGNSDQFRDKSLYRPFTMSTYAVNYALNKARPAGYHAINILLHALAGVVLFRLISDIFGAREVGFVSAILFAVHPIHTEAVAGIVGRAEILAFLGIFLTVWCCFRGMSAWAAGGRGTAAAGWFVGSASAFAMGLFSKETGVLAPAVLILTQLFAPSVAGSKKFNWRATPLYVAMAAILLLYFWIRARVTISTVGVFGLESMPTSERIFTGLRVCVQYVSLLLFPIHQSADYTLGSALFAKSATHPAVLLAFGALAVTAVFLVRARGLIPLACWGVLLFLGALFPVSNLPFLIGVLKAERLLYTPSAGFIVAFVAVIHYYFWTPRNRTVLMWAAVIAATLLLVGTFKRNEVWRNDLALTTVSLRENPDSLPLQGIMARWWREHGRNDLAREYLTRSLGRGPAEGEISTLYNLGNLELDQKRYPAAIGYYQKVLVASPNHFGAANNLARALTESGDIAGAMEILTDLCNGEPTNPGPYINLINLYERQGRLGEALPIVETGLKKFPDSDALLWNAAAVYKSLGRQEEAERMSRRAQEINGEISSQSDVKRPFN